jgi:hypothetical protein
MTKMNKKRNSNRPILAPVRLVTQSNDFEFVTREFLKENPMDPFDPLQGKHYKGPAKTFDIDEGGYFHDPEDENEKDFEKLADDPELQKIFKKFSKCKTKHKTIQRVTIYEADEKGLYFDETDLNTLPKRMYLKLAEQKTDRDLSQFIRKYFDFCDFPTEEEKRNIQKNDGWLKIQVPTEKNKTRAANWLHLFRKRGEIVDVIENYSNGKPTKTDYDYLQKQVSQKIAKISVDKNDFAYKELKDDEAEFETLTTENIEEFMKPKKLGGSNIVPGYLVFGHFALCCLELLTDIKKSVLVRFCQNPQCKKHLPVDGHKNRKFCKKEDNPECYKQWRNDARKKDLLNQKVRKRAPSKKISRNL